MWKKGRKGFAAGCILFFTVCMTAAAQTPEGGNNIPMAVQDVSLGDAAVSSGDMTAEKEKRAEVIKMVLPTEYVVLMYKEPEQSGMRIQSQDIVVVNQSDFPVTVRVKEMTCKERTSGAADGISWALSLREFQKGETVMKYDTDSFAPFSFELEKAGGTTEADALLKEAEAWNPIGSAESGDYGILRINGETEADELKAEDITVGLVFEFERAQG